MNTSDEEKGQTEAIRRRGRHELGRQAARRAQNHCLRLRTQEQASSQEVEAQLTMPLQLRVFQNFLRAFCPYVPVEMTSSTVTLPLQDGDVVLVHAIHTNGWADGTVLSSAARGWLPTNYCEAFDPEPLRILLHALVNVWDSIRSALGANASHEMCEAHVRSMVAGVRFLLVRYLFSLLYQARFCRVPLQSVGYCKP
jgi:hypothetical protein